MQFWKMENNFRRERAGERVGGREKERERPLCNSPGNDLPRHSSSHRKTDSTTLKDSLPVNHSFKPARTLQNSNKWSIPLSCIWTLPADSINPIYIFVNFSVSGIERAEALLFRPVSTYLACVILCWNKTRLMFNWIFVKSDWFNRDTGKQMRWNTPIKNTARCTLWRHKIHCC